MAQAWPNALPRYCSAVCGKRRDREIQRDRRRCAELMVVGEPVSRRKVFVRDNWCCQLCGYPVDRDATVPDDWAPTLDHIVPVSPPHFGEHSYANVQTAHFICNSRKGARVELAMVA